MVPLSSACHDQLPDGKRPARLGHKALVACVVRARQQHLPASIRGRAICAGPWSVGKRGVYSEHGFANAVDVTGFTLEDGRKIAVEANWMPAAAPEGRLLRLAHDAACGDFTTVLGPEADEEHHDHLHLDLGCHGQSCTARICE